MLWGQSQPETVRDYTVQILSRGDWSTALEVTGNYQRLRRHSVETTILASAVRILVTATNGVDHARVMEVRIQ